MPTKTKNDSKANNSRLIIGQHGENPKLMARALNDGRESLYLVYYSGYKETTSKTGKAYLRPNRKLERLGLFLEPGRASKEHNREVLEIAKKLRFEREQQLKESEQGFRLASRVKIDLLDWMREYYKGYSKPSKGMIRTTIKAFMDFLTDPHRELLPGKDWTEGQKKAAKEERKKRAALQRLSPRQFNGIMAGQFVDYLQARYNGESARAVYLRFKTMIRVAIKDGTISGNPFEDVKTPKIDRMTLKKDILSLDEIAQLAATHYSGENPDVRRAFLFSCYAGLRWCDVVELTFADVDFSRGLLTFTQNKTEGHSSASGVNIPLSPTLKALIGHPGSAGTHSGLIFNLPSYPTARLELQRWLNAAAIKKHITWHCARHSFAVNVLSNGANIKTVSDLLGHSGLQCTQVYLHVVDKLKEDAINSLPALEL